MCSCTMAAAAVKPTDSPFWQAARPSPSAMWLLPVPGVAERDDVLPALDVQASPLGARYRLASRSPNPSCVDTAVRRMRGHVSNLSRVNLPPGSLRGLWSTHATHVNAGPTEPFEQAGELRR